MNNFIVFEKEFFVEVGFLFNKCGFGLRLVGQLFCLVRFFGWVFIYFVFVCYV